MYRTPKPACSFRSWLSPKGISSWIPIHGSASLALDTTIRADIFQGPAPKVLPAAITGPESPASSAKIAQSFAKVVYLVEGFILATKDGSMLLG